MRDLPSTKTSHPTLADRLQHIEDDKRGVKKSVPIDLGRYLNASQLLALQSLENFGWRLWFVRRPLFMSSIVVVINADATQHAVLDEDGSVNLKPQIHFRH